MSSSGGGGSSAAAPASGPRGFGRRGSLTAAPPSRSGGSSRGSERAIRSPGDSWPGLGGSHFVRRKGAIAPARTRLRLFRTCTSRCSSGSAAFFSRLRSRLRRLARFCPIRAKATELHSRGQLPLLSPPPGPGRARDMPRLALPTAIGLLEHDRAEPAGHARDGGLRLAPRRISPLRAPFLPHLQPRYEIGPQGSS